VGDNLLLRFISAMDAGLRCSDGSSLYDWERSIIMNIYGAAAYVVSYTREPLPRDFSDRLQWATTSWRFPQYEFSEDNLNAIARLLLRATPDGSGCVPQSPLSYLLGNIERRFLPVSPESLAWVLAAFQLPSSATRLVHGLQRYPSAMDALSTSHLSLLKPVSTPDEVRRSPWSQVRSIVPLESSSKELGEIVRGYTVLLLVLHRRGYREQAQALLRELLPYDWAARLISLDVDHRYHLALHAKLISQAWYREVSDLLLESSPAQRWVSCTTYPDATTFAEALRLVDDCLDCAHDGVRIEWGAAPVPPEANAAEIMLSVNNYDVWTPPAAIAINEVPRRIAIARTARRILRIRETSNGPESPGQPDDVLERGPAPEPPSGSRQVIVV